MDRLLLFSILLVVVYSWEEFKYTLRVLAYGLVRKKNKKEFETVHLDSFVSSLVMLIGIPLMAANLLATNKNLTDGLFTLAWQLLLISFVAASLGTLVRRINRLCYAQTAGEKTIVITSTLVGMALPFRLAGHSRLERKILARFAFLLSLPALIGLAFKYFSDQTTRQDLIPNMDLLIRVMIIAMFIHVVITFLESQRHRRFGKLSVYFRVILGIVITAILITGN